MFIYVLIKAAALIVTKDKMVYDLSVNENGRLGISDNNKIFQPKKVEALCGRNIKTLCCDSSGGPVHALTEEGEVLWKLKIYIQNV